MASAKTAQDREPVLDRDASHQAALGFSSTSRHKERLLHPSPTLGCNGPQGDGRLDLTTSSEVVSGKIGSGTFHLHRPTPPIQTGLSAKKIIAVTRKEER
jgi:hypothetical protein